MRNPLKPANSFVAAFLGLVILVGCGRARLSLEFVPGTDALVSDVVLEDPAAEGTIALFDVTGLIADVRRSGLLSDGENPVDRFVEALKAARNDPSVRAVIVRINSPGGTVTASDVMYRELQRFKQESNKPVVILMADVAASGGYYLACAGDEIVAHPTTVTGSVGVIIQTINFSEGMKMIGIRADSITSGPNKTMGSPFEPMKSEHRELLQGLVNDFYGNFRGVVLANRPKIAALSKDDADGLLDGRVFTGSQALEHGFVDTLGDLHTAFDRAKARANLAAARLVKYHRPGGHVATPYADSPAPTPTVSSQINLVQMNLAGSPWLDQVGFWYVWMP